MKKIRCLLHVVLVAVIIVGIIGLAGIVKGLHKSYMTEEEVEERVSEMFYEDTSGILENIGLIAEFNDKYSSDEMEVPNTNGQTVGQLKQEYQTNKHIVDEDEDMRNHIFYYIPDELEADEEGYVYIDKAGRYYSSEEVEKYGIKSYEEYENKKKYYKARIDFFQNYIQMQNAINENSFTENLSYYVRYTEPNGLFREFYSDDGKKITAGSSNYQTYFLFDRKNSTALMENLEKAYAGYESLVYKCKTFTDYEDFYAVFAINEQYLYDDFYSYHGTEVITDGREIAEYQAKIAMTSMAALIAFFVLFALLILTGKTEEKKTKLYLIDYLWWDVSITVLIVLYAAVAGVFQYVGIFELETERDIQYFDIYLFMGIECGVISLLSIARRIKGRYFIKSSMLGLLFIKTGNILKKLWQHLGATKKALMCGVATFGYMMAVSYTFVYGIHYGDYFYVIMWILLAVGLLAVVCYIVWKFHAEYDEIAEETRNIASGDINNKIDKPLRFEANRRMAFAVNNIGEGIMKAVDANVKNERMKTDLITNVSHDIKTPLTSIINYVNLLKMEDTGNEKINNYIRILDEKSQRLKILTDDLVEASKLSSGVIELQFQKLNLVELIKQSAGEYEEKFKEKFLEVIMNLPFYPVYVRADGRKMWRVLENLYSNIYKYALKGTRVYMDLSVINHKVILCVKNISDSPLNFESNELTERFIRGDVSRSTEGSGLGLSIAKSIIDRHEGEFKIVLDGDLFKVIVKLNEYSEKEEVEEVSNENQ